MKNIDLTSSIRVTHESTNDEILEAIKSAGAHRIRWRRYDWPEEGSNNTYAWVKPGDIGPSKHNDNKLLKRLRKMVKEGLLEERFGSFGQLRVYKKGWKQTITRGMFPRFRVILK